MAKKDFAGMNTGRVYEAIEKSTSRRGQQTTATPEEVAERKATNRTQGRKGCHKDGMRINLKLDPDNHEFISIMSKATGRNMTQFINDVISAYRNEHPEFLEKAEGFLEFINSGAFTTKKK